MLWKLAAAVIAAIVAAQVPGLKHYWGWVLVVGMVIAVLMQFVRILQQTSVRLVPLTAEHLNSDALIELLGARAPIESLLAVDADGGVMRTIMVRGEPVGVVAVMPDEELMVAVASAYRRRGIARSAIKQLAPLAFEQKGIRKVKAKTMIGRPSSQLAQQLGAVEVGRSEKEIFYEVSAEAWSRRERNSK